MKSSSQKFSRALKFLPIIVSWAPVWTIDLFNWHSVVDPEGQEIEKSLIGENDHSLQFL